MTKARYIFVLVAASLIPSFVSAKNLGVPFTSQAPYGNWSEPWNNACEETAIAMIDAYYGRKIFSTPTVARQKILSVLTIKNKYIGYSLDENAAKILTLINNFFPWEAAKVSNPTLEQIKQELDADRPVIALAYGRALHNPNFRDGGPVYHVFAISGYDDDTQQFITQEPGTRRGLDFRYSYDTIMNALHDYVPGGKTKTGTPVVLFTSPDINTAGNSDGDRDGLTKAEEIKYGTSLSNKDTDGDGYLDGAEVKSGHSPTKK